MSLVPERLVLDAQKHIAIMVHTQSQPGNLPRRPSLPASIGRLQAASVNATNKILSYDPQPGMWAATGTAIAHAPNLNDLRSDSINFDADGHLARMTLPPGPGHTKRATTSPNISPIVSSTTDSKGLLNPVAQRSTNSTTTTEPETPKTWQQTILTGLAAFWSFFRTPTGFLITIYGLNVVAWGAMLFFLLLKAAPAMNHPDNGDADSSPRKIWIEIDSQILNALFCLTAWGLAPWRFRDLWWLCVWRFGRNADKSKRAIRRLAARNVSWFRLHESELMEKGEESVNAALVRRETFSGRRAPATAPWKMDFVVWMMVLNSLFQVGMAFMMWHWNRIDRPAWGAGLFIGLGCGVSMFSGVMCWWEGRKIKKIEGPKLLGNGEKEPGVV